MTEKAVLSSLLAGILELDNAQAVQVLLSRPALVGPLLGWINGCPAEGAKIGLLTELIYMDFIPIGGVIPPNGLVAAAVGVLGFAWAGLPEAAAFFAGSVSGLVYGKVESSLRTFRSRANGALDAAALAGDFGALPRRLAVALAGEAAVTAVYIFFFSGLLFPLAGLLSRSPDWFLRAGDFAYSLMPWLGLTGLYFRFRTQAFKNS